MHRFARILTLLAVCCWAITGCASGIETGTTAAALTTGACNPAGNPSRSADVTYSSGTCVRYSMSGTPLLQQNYLIPSPTLGTVVSVRTGSQAAAWVCDQNSPWGFSASPYAPCWSGGVNNGFVRVRGAWVNAVPTYAGASATISTIVGRSLVLTLGTLAGNLPVCNSLTALHWHPFGGAFNGDSGMNSYTGNNDPADGPGSQLTAPWPDGTSGSPCYSNQTPGGYGEVYYAPF